MNDNDAFDNNYNYCDNDNENDIDITSGNEKNSRTFSPVSIQLCGSMALTRSLSTISVLHALDRN